MTATNNSSSSTGGGGGSPEGPQFSCLDCAMDFYSAPQLKRHTQYAHRGGEEETQFCQVRLNHRPNILIDSNPKCRLLGTWRQVFICLRPPSPPRFLFAWGGMQFCRFGQIHSVGTGITCLCSSHNPILHAKDLMLVASYSEFQVCSEKCEGTENLRLHLYKVHGRGEMFRCEECNFETSTKAVYIKHLRYCTLYGEMFRCEE
jgi:hypothetical protein